MAELNQSEMKMDSAADQELATLVAAGWSDTNVPDRVVVAPWGEVNSTAGAFVVDEESGRAVTEAFIAHGTDLPIDYEHQTLGGSYASPRGTAPAAGWITALAVVPGEGIVATVNWTSEARQMLAAKQYRYLSPVAVIRKRDRKLVALHSAALTNKPAIVGMAALVHRDTVATTAEADERLAALCARLHMATDAGVAAVVAAAAERIAALESETALREAESVVAAAGAAGKLTEPLRAWALTMALEHRALFDAWALAAPVVVATGRTTPPDGENGVGGTRVVAAAARAEYRHCAALRALTSEEAYVADAARRAVLNA